AYRQHKNNLFSLQVGSSIHDFRRRGNAPPKKTANDSPFLPAGKFFAFAPKKGLHFARSRAIIIAFPFGGLAQLVRAPASHAGGLGFESLILHQTVRIQTHASMRMSWMRFFFARGAAPRSKD